MNSVQLCLALALLTFGGFISPNSCGVAMEIDGEAGYLSHLTGSERKAAQELMENTFLNIFGLKRPPRKRSAKIPYIPSYILDLYQRNDVEEFEGHIGGHNANTVRHFHHTGQCRWKLKISKLFTD